MSIRFAIATVVVVVTITVAETRGAAVRLER